LSDAIDRADWRPPETLTAVVLPRSAAAVARSQLDERTLELDSELAALVEWPQHVVLLVPGDGPVRSSRAALMAAVAQQDAVVGPARPWRDVRSSLSRAVRVLELGIAADAGGAGTAVDTDEHLASLVLGADEVAR